MRRYISTSPLQKKIIIIQNKNHIQVMIVNFAWTDTELIVNPKTK